MNIFTIFTITFILNLVDYILSQDADEDTKEIFCRDRERPIGGEVNDIFQTVEVIAGQSIILQCNYCKETDNKQPKIWYKANSIGNVTEDEIKLDMTNDRNMSRIYISADHSLVILNITHMDGSFYFCQQYKVQDVEKDLNFYVDVVDVNKTTVESGNITDWAEYQKQNFFPVNQLFIYGNGPEYVRLRDTLKVHLELITTWDAWSDCEVCGRPLGEGIKKKHGHCRIKITRMNSTDTNSTFSKEERLLVTTPEIGCRSRILGKLAPGIFNMTKVIPDFIQIEGCSGTCNPDAQGKYRGWKSTKKTGFKYRRTIVLTDNSHLTLVCPESTLENVVVWKRNGRTLTAGESVPPPKPHMEPKITVDTFNTLYLHEVTKNEEGNYTCFVDDIRMQQTMIFVASKSRLLTQALLRHMMYLGFILSLTLSCYVAGLAITWTRRRKFKTYEAIRKRRKKLLLSSSSSDENDDDDDKNDDNVEEQDDDDVPLIIKKQNKNKDSV